MSKEAQDRHNYYLERSMYEAWLRELGSTNEDQIFHLKNCVQYAIKNCLTDKQRQYLSLYMSGYNQLEISRMCGVNKSTVSRTLNRGINRIMDHVKYASPRTLKVSTKVKKNLTRLYHGGGGRSKKEDQGGQPNDDNQ